MKAVFHTGIDPPWTAPLGRPWPLLPFGNRPWIEFWIEWCVAQHITEVHIVLGEDAHAVESYLGDGGRWGLCLSYHFHRQPDLPGSFLRRSPERWRDGIFLLHHPAFPRRASDAPPAPLPPGDAIARNGNALTACLARTPSTLAALLGDQPIDAPPFDPATLDPCTVSGLQQYFDLNMAMVDGEISRYLTPGYRRQDRAYLGFNVVYPPTAQLAEPLIIGNDVRIRGLATVGPRAILGHRIIVDRQADISDSLIFDGSYLGAGIEVRGRIVDGNRLIDPSDGTVLDLDDLHLLAPLRQAGSRGERARRLAHRILALLLFLIITPPALLALAIGWLTGGRYVRQPILGVRGPQEVEHWIPGPRTPAWITRLSLHEWPLLLRVARGELWLSGQQMLSPDEKDEATSWPTYRPGLFTYADLRPNPADPLLRRIEAAYYAHHRGWQEDLRILWRGWWARLAGHALLAPPPEN
jgi:hypothetical protein